VHIADRIKDFLRIPGSKIRPNPKNWRTHPVGQTDALKAILAKYGIAAPCIVYPVGDGTYETAGEGKEKRHAGTGTFMLIDGHAREEIVGEQPMPCCVLDVTAEEADGLLLTFDPVGDLAGADRAKLEALMDSCRFEEPAIQEMLANLIDQQEEAENPAAGEGGDEFDPTPAEEDSGPTQANLGGVWLLGGKHKLLVGSCTDGANVTRLMAGKKATMCFTDPPWNVAIGKDSNPRHRQRAGLENDDLSAEDFRAFIAAFAGEMIKVVEGDLYCVLGASEWPTLDSVLRECGFHWSATIIWVKDLFVLGRSKYHRRYEPIWYGWRKKGSSSFGERRDLDDVWEIDRPRRSGEHPTMKPIELMERAIENSSRPGDLIYEPFMGSGSTMIAAHRQGRVCYGCEIAPVYADVILKRAEAEGMKVELLEPATAKATTVPSPAPAG
jgi:DNA modification methylase